MALISSHVLDSVVGDHASGIRIGLYRFGNDDQRELVFDVMANEQGRIAEEVEVAEGGGAYELVFYTAVYFKSQPAMLKARQIMDTVVVRFKILDPHERIHIPLVLSPHSYTIWWSA